MKKLLAIILIVSVTFTSCLKDTPAVDFSNVGSLMEIQFHDVNGNEHGGLESFGNDGLSFASAAPDTMYFVTNFASPTTQNQTVTVTVGVNDAARVAYNATSAIQFTPMPSNCYKLINTTATLTPGNRLDTFYVVFYPANMDPTQTYMLPCGIVSATAGGKNINISANFGNIYWHVIGNVLAGTYNVAGTRYNYTGLYLSNNGFTASSSIPFAGYVSTAASPSPESASVNSPTEITLPYANLGSSGYYYIIDFTGSTPSSVNVSPGGLLASNVSNFTIYKSSVTWNGTKPTIHLTTSYNNALGGAGNDRLIDEVFTHQ